MLKVSKANIANAPIIYTLVKELGYSINKEVFHHQIQEALHNENHQLWVALNNDTVVGYIHIIRTIRLTSPTFYEIVALAVNSNNRRQGIGKLLVNKALKITGAKHPIRVRCNIKREEAHQFYNSLGFTESKMQKVFEKQAD